jgi:hypothetical protein
MGQVFFTALPDLRFTFKIHPFTGKAFKEYRPHTTFDRFKHHI